MKLFAYSVALAITTISAATGPDAAAPCAWYQAASLQTNGLRVTAWGNAAASGHARALTHTVGQPRAFRVKSASGDQTILRLDGKSALWQAAGQWGALGEGRTVLAVLRLPPGAEGFLFDGSTKSGRSHAQVSNGTWRVGFGTDAISPTHEAKTGTWQVHAFTFAKAADGADIAHAIAGVGTKTVHANAVQPVSGFILGADAATQNGLECDIAEVIVHDRALTDAERNTAVSDLQKRWGQPADLPEAQQPQTAKLPDDPRIFRTVVRKQGDDGVHTYRIPGLATSAKGTLLAVFDVRHKSKADLPADIDVGFMRSSDNGATWSAMQRIMDYDAAVPGSRGNGVGDPAILVDRKTGTIFVAALWSKGARGWAGSGPGMTPDETGQLVICKSTDDGLTWSKPVSITPQVKDPAWRLCFNGPGCGIQIRDGSLVFAAQYKGANNVPHSCFIASSDHGETWKISPPAIPAHPPTSEAQIVECRDSSLLLTMRDESHSGKRAWARWRWNDSLLKGQWSEPWSAVTDPTCMAGILIHPDGTLLLSNPNDARTRFDLTIRSSTDDGKTWSRGRLLDPRLASYSCMTVLKDGSIGILYEAGEKTIEDTLTFARFPLEWVLEGASSPSVPEARPAGKGKFGWWMQRHEQKLAEAKAGAEIVFLGDSITQGWETAGKDIWARQQASRRTLNLGFGGDSTQHALWRLDNGEFDGLHPKVCVLLIGTNNVRHSDSTPQQIAEGIGAIIGRIAKKSPDTKIILHAIFPRGADASDPWRQRAQQINALLPALADGQRVHFLDIGSAFTGPGGIVSKEVMPDLLHLSAKGYDLWARALEPKLTELLATP
ncbi:MAG: exo-alpha-sialidase [Verrucomicrobiales bacterium]|nr:exo-alpha-sialidase [Verrucomicrobiales bacterium]